MLVDIQEDSVTNRNDEYLCKWDVLETYHNFGLGLPGE